MKKKTAIFGLILGLCSSIIYAKPLTGDISAYIIAPNQHIATSTEIAKHRNARIDCSVESFHNFKGGITVDLIGKYGRHKKFTFDPSKTSSSWFTIIRPRGAPDFDIFDVGLAIDSSSDFTLMNANTYPPNVRCNIRNTKQEPRQ